VGLYERPDDVGGGHAGDRAGVTDHRFVEVFDLPPVIDLAPAAPTEPPSTLAETKVAPSAGSER
jgi:hypothetical protein